MAIPNKEFPLVPRVLKLVQVETNQVVEEIAFDLSTKNIKSRAKDVESVAVTPSRSRTWGYRSGPLTRSCNPDMLEYEHPKKSQVNETIACIRTCVQEIERVIQGVGFVHLSIASKYDESVTNQQAGMADSRAWPFGDSSDREAGQVTAAVLHHPQISLDS